MEPVIKDYENLIKTHDSHVRLQELSNAILWFLKPHFFYKQNCIMNKTGNAKNTTSQSWFESKQSLEILMSIILFHILLSFFLFSEIPKVSKSERDKPKWLLFLSTFLPSTYQREMPGSVLHFQTRPIFPFWRNRTNLTRFIASIHFPEGKFFKNILLQTKHLERRNCWWAKKEKLTCLNI